MTDFLKQFESYNVVCDVLLGDILSKYVVLYHSIPIKFKAPLASQQYYKTSE